MCAQERRRDGMSSITAAIRDKISAGELSPGDRLPTMVDLAVEYGVNKNTASRAITQLKNEGLLTGFQGGHTTVREKPVTVTRHNLSYQEEKDNVHKSETERRQTGAAERNLGIPVQELNENSAVYRVIDAPADVQEILSLNEGDKVLERIFTRRATPLAGAGQAYSYIPYEIVKENPRLLDQEEEPWPGGTQHQLFTVGIEIDRIEDRISSSMPTEEEQQLFDVPSVVPMIRIVKISYDTTGRPVEVAFVPVPADRANLIYTTVLGRW